MPHVDLAILSLETEVVRMTAVRSSMAATTTVPTVPNAVALRNRVASLATPRALDQVSIVRKGGKRASCILHGPDFVGRETGGSHGKVPFNVVA